MRIIQKQISENKKRILMGIIVVSLLNCIDGYVRMQVPEIPKFSTQSKSPDSTDLYITNFVYTFDNKAGIKKESMTHGEYEAKMQSILVSYLGARGFYKSVQLGKPPTDTKNQYITAEVNIESRIGDGFWKEYFIYNLPMFFMTPFIWPFHTLHWKNKIKGSAILKDQEGNIVEQIEANKEADYLMVIYSVFRDPAPADEAMKNNHTNFFTELTDKLTVPIEHKNAPAESKPKFTILGEVFAPKGGLVDLKYSGTDVRMGSILYIFQDGQPVCKMVVTQAFHTKVTAKIISSSVTLVKGMQFGKLN